MHIALVHLQRELHRLLAAERLPVELYLHFLGMVGPHAVEVEGDERVAQHAADVALSVVAQVELVYIILVDTALRMLLYLLLVRAPLMVSLHLEFLRVCIMNTL